MYLLSKFLTKGIKTGRLIVTDHDGREYTFGPGDGEWPEEVGGNVQLEPASLEDMCGGAIVEKSSLEVVYDDV